jgi:hypothetical protein
VAAAGLASADQLNLSFQEHVMFTNEKSNDRLPILPFKEFFTPGGYTTIFEEVGIVGCLELALLAFLVLISCRRRKPLHLILTGSSAAGKTHLIKTILRNFIPLPWWISTVSSSITGAALSRHPKRHFKHKVLFLEESCAKDEAAETFIRLLQSEFFLKRSVTGSSGNAENLILEGPTAVVETTSDDPLSFKEDNLTRGFIATMDESLDMTKRIMERQAMDAQDGTKNSNASSLAAEITRYLSAIGSIPDIDNPTEVGGDSTMSESRKPAYAHLDVRIPFASHIIPKVTRLRDRRDFPKILGLVDTIAWFRLAEKEILGEGDQRYILADFSDYEIAFPLLEYSYRAMGVDNRVSIGHLEILKNSLKKESTFTQRDFEAATGLGRTRTKMVIRDLLEHGVIDVVRSARGAKPATYTLTDVKISARSPLVTPEELSQTWNP